MKPPKKALATLCALLFLLAIVPACAQQAPMVVAAAQPGDADLSMAAALAAAREAIMQKQEVSLDQLDSYPQKANYVLLADGSKAWIVVFFETVFDNPTYTAITILSPAASVIDFQTTNVGTFKNVRDAWESSRGPYGKWRLEDKVLFSNIFTLPDFNEMVMPDASMISQEQAASIAQRLLPDGYTSDMLQFEFFHQSGAEMPYQEYIWQISAYLNEEQTHGITISGVDGTVLDFFSVSNYG